jgi:hypothetical protein
MGFIYIYHISSQALWVLFWQSNMVAMGISGSKTGGTEPYKAIFCGDIPLHRP